MIVVFANGKGEFDFIILTSIQYCMARVGGSVARYSPTLKFSDTELAIIGHGAPGKIEGVSAWEIAKHLTDKVNGVTTLTKLIITSCYAGSPVPGVPNSAVIDIIASRFRNKGMCKGLTIEGATGPSIKANSLGAHFKVVDPQGDMDYASAAQSFLKTQHEQLPDHSATFNNSFQMQIAASAAEMTSRTFYSQFVSLLEARGVLKADNFAMRSVTV